MSENRFRNMREVDDYLEKQIQNEKRFRVNDLVKYDYSEIGEYVDENHTDRPLRNDEVCDLLNEQDRKIRQLEKVIEDE